MIPLRFQPAVNILAFFFTALFSSALPAASSPPAKLAIVIDDIGYHPQDDAAILAMPKEISVAIIPSAPYARQRHDQAQAQGRDILIHMPMQPMGKHKIEEGGLHLGMTREEVGRRVQKAKNVLPAAIGMNNHMGSAATADNLLMNYLMNELHKQQLSFLDSRTIGRSVAGKIAKEQGIKTLERHIFLDNSDFYEDVHNQFQQAVLYARKNGTAIVIGHPRKNTVAVLQAGLRNLPSDIQLVGIGSLWRNEKSLPSQPLILLFSDQPAPTSGAPFEGHPLLRGVPK